MADILDNETQNLFLNALLERGYKFIGRTDLPRAFEHRKAYIWIEDPNGTLILERLPE